MIIVAIAWIYVVLMMAITEHSIVAGVMTFLMYCVLPLTIIVYLFGAPQRKRRRQIREKLQILNQTPPSSEISEGDSAADVSQKEVI